MSEKRLRFTMESDKLYSCIFDNGNELTCFELVDLLNRLYQENEHLIIGNKNLMKKNEQLKEEHKVAIDEMITDYKNLEKENEQLQKKYDNLNSAIEKTAIDMAEKTIYEGEDFDVFQRITDYVEELEDV